MSGDIERKTSLCATEKLSAGDNFLQHLFWRLVMVPTINAQIGALFLELCACPLKDVVRVRADIKALETVLEMPEMIMASARQDIELDRYQREQSGEVEEKE